VVVQHDDELIMPGDAAFTLECDFSRPRDITVSADLEAGRSVYPPVLTMMYSRRSYRNYELHPSSGVLNLW
jgi:hypothetical protein